MTTVFQKSEFAPGGAVVLFDVDVQLRIGQALDYEGETFFVRFAYEHPDNAKRWRAIARKKGTPPW